MLRSNMDLIGMYTYDSTILDNLVMPTDENESPLLDTDVVKDNLLLDTAELELIYSDINFMKTAIGMWSKKQVKVWTDLYNTTVLEYNPIWNKDGTIKEKITRNLRGSDDRTTDLTTTRDLTLTDDYTRTDNLAHTDDATTTTDVYGYNSGTAAPKTKVTVDNDTSDTGTQRNAGTHTDDGTVRTAGYDNHATTDIGTIQTERTEQGNIGVTSTQQLIKEQREVVEMNVIDYIINDFKKRFCLQVY